jgi:Golgi phosphoprotein 3
MDLNLIDQLTLLALDDKKGSIIPDSISFSYAIAGAVILELALEEKVDISHELVRTKDRTKTGDTILDKYFDLIQQSKKERKIKSWVDRIGNKAEQIKKDTIEKLIAKRILEKKEEKILWVFTVNKYPAQNSRPENQLRNRLYDIIVYGHKPDLKEIMLLNLIESCSLGKEVFGKEQVKLFKKKIKQINESDDLAGVVNKSIKEITDAIHAILVIMIATTVIHN